MELTTTLSLIAQGLLIIALPIVIAAAVQHFRAMTQQLRMKLSEEQRQNIDQAISVGVKVAEQTGLIQGLVGPEKKKQAIQIAEKFLADKGIKLDLEKLSDLIEAEVQTQFSHPTPVVDSPEARQQLINQAVQTAVQAAEQGGLTGLIQNLAAEKKAYAAGLALKYLDQYGIKLDPQLLGGLIDSQQMQYVMAGRTAQPVAPAATPTPVAVPPPPVYVPPAPPAPAYIPPAPAPAVPVQPPAPGPSTSSTPGSGPVG